MASIVELLLDTAKADTDLLLQNDARGDILATPRRVDFLLRASTAEKAELVADFINDNRYGNATIVNDQDGPRIQVEIDMPITQHVICSVSGLMACISKVFDIEYDGWGSVIQPGT
ncbi:MAG: ribonuclease E inhibitor RraB [Bacteroidota bacterium]